ncbi:MAG: cache domain-containing protein [Pseudomonadota bacterium]
MNNWIKSVALACLLSLAGAAGAGELGTADEAVAMVNKAVAYLAEHGREQALAEINKPKGRFVDRDLYVVVHDMHGTVLANAQLQRMVGKDVSEVKDIDGRQFVKERLKMLATAKSGWNEFQWPNSVTQKIDRRSTYFVREGDLVLTCGILKKTP